MNNKDFSPTQRVTIVADENFSNTGLIGHKGVVVSSKGSFVDVLLTSGEFLGKTLSFLSTHLKKEY